jgi:ABC-type branched-subunit amino acid transport system ATPase component
VGLQPNLVERVMEVAEQINRDFGITVILVEQNIDKALSVAHRVAVVNRGRVVLNKLTGDVESKEIWDLL